MTLCLHVTFEDGAATRCADAQGLLAALDVATLSARLRAEGWLDEIFRSVVSATFQKTASDGDEHEGRLRLVLHVEIDTRENIELLYPEILLDHIAASLPGRIYNDFDWKIAAIDEVRREAA